MDGTRSWEKEYGRLALFPSAKKNQGLDFIHLVKEVVEGKGRMVKTVETVSIAENTNANQSLGDGKPMYNYFIKVE
ncbi:hypothetical protein YC2023_021149 [Brassica napus]